MSPDHTLSINDKIITKPDSMCCMITCRYSVKATYLLDVSRGDVMHHMMSKFVGMLM